MRNYAAALQYGVERLSEVPLDSKLVLELHERLLRGVRDAAWTPGEFRTGQSWIGPPGSTIEAAVYVPPPVTEMGAALAEWDRFLSVRTGLPPLVQCALVHERFETIHPFLEGNGRLGRLLITLFLIERGRLSHPLLYPSAYIEAHRDQYYGLLQAVRTDGAWDPWLHFFADAVRETAERASEQVRALMALREQYRWKVSGHARELVDDLFRTPFVTVPEAQQTLGVSNATARKAVRELQEWGMLEELAARRWPRAYIARPILDAMQAPLEDLRLTSAAKPKAPPLKSGTDLEEPPEKPAERHMAEAMALIDEARRFGVQVRLMGGLAVRRYCADLVFMDREYSDIDLVGLSLQNRGLHEVLTRLGYAENRLVTEATGAGQLQYVKTDVLQGAGAYRIGAAHGSEAAPEGGPASVEGPLVDHVDLFLDVMRMDHDLDVRDRLLIDDYAISPADAFIGKLQIGRLNAKDAHDVIALVKDVPLRRTDDEHSLCVPYIAETCAGDWGLCQDVLANIDGVLVLLAEYDLDDEERSRVQDRLGADPRGDRGGGEAGGLAPPGARRQACRVATERRGPGGHRRDRARVGLAARPGLRREPANVREGGGYGVRPDRAPGGRLRVLQAGLPGRRRAARPGRLEGRGRVPRRRRPRQRHRGPRVGHPRAGAGVRRLAGARPGAGVGRERRLHAASDGAGRRVRVASLTRDARPARAAAPGGRLHLPCVCGGARYSVAYPRAAKKGWPVWCTWSSSTRSPTSRC